jgi:hypothetical protein
MALFTLNIEVTFIDDRTGKSIGVTQIPSTELPESFEQDTTIHLHNADWRVINSRPKTRTQYSKSQTLVLWIDRIAQHHPSDILYSLPSICDVIPAVSNQPLIGRELTIAEDDWRQFELISHKLADKVDREISKIQLIRENAVTGNGWRSIHLRSKPAIPIVSNMVLTYLANILKVSAKSTGITYYGSHSPIVDGYSFSLNDDFSIYGVAPKSKVQVIAIGQDSNISPNPESIDHLQQLARKFNLDLVHWCRCVRVSPDEPSFRSLLSEFD